MEFQYFGGNCISIATKKATLVIDDNLAELGLKSITKQDNVSLYTHIPKKVASSRLVITDPGEYEVSEVSIFGIAARAHMDESGAQSATIYKIQYDDLRVAIVGHIHPDLSEDHLESLGLIDILIIPVGGNGYTLDAVGAMQIVKKTEPKIVIPTHYEDTEIAYPVPQQPLSEALKVFGVEAADPISKFKPKPVDFSDNLRIVVLDRQ
jgi:L-ascorbate metabolism protein UlaG (beta-lactamase superfamily)